MLTENDNLRSEVKSLNRSLQRTAASTGSKVSMIEGMTSEIITLRDELNSVKDQRDNALQEVLILKQVSTFYKQKDEQEVKDIEDKLFT